MEKEILNKKYEDFLLRMRKTFNVSLDFAFETEKQKAEKIRNERKKKLERIYGKRNFE